MRRRSFSLRPEDGFTLVEMLVVVFLLAIAMLGLLAVFDAGTRINKNEQEIADAQGSVRYGIFQMSRVIRMAGAGGLFVTQAVLTQPDPNFPGVTAPGGSFDNVVGGTVTNLAGAAVPVRPGTDIIEVRGVILSPLLGFDLTSGCGTCTGVSALNAKPRVYGVSSGEHVNNDPQRPQFSAIDSHTAGATPENPMFVIVSANDDLHPGCSDPRPGGVQRNSQPTYNVGLLSAPTTLAAASNTFGNVNFASSLARQLTTEMPAEVPSGPEAVITSVRRAGVLDDILYFIDDTDPHHPALAQAIRRGNRFDVVAIAEDVENMQVAYGVDGLYGGGADGAIPNEAVGRLSSPSGDDNDPNVSTQANGDEWAPNVTGEAMFAPTDFQSEQPPPANFTHTGLEDCHNPTLHSVMVALVAKSRNPDPTYRAPNAAGLRTMNSPAAPSLYPTPVTSPRYRRRIQVLKINLRNYAVPG